MDTILIANRGEIACRVIRSARALGYRTVAVFSEADADAPHVRLADRACCIGPPPAGASYLDGARVLAAARAAGADAIHPGYGFLSENSAFARACEDAGLTFIGPPSAAIELMGNKAAAKRRMIAAGVPCVPGFQDAGEDAQTIARLQQEGARVGFPLLVKAAAGGGGRGMRRVTAPEQLADALQAARAEAESAFGSGELILERALDHARHVEVQVFGDQHGTVIHLGERDCSVQRRHQKVLEEAPSPAVDDELRARMGAAAVRAAAAIGYVGAGTVEFLLAADGAFYFLEMNTRLQVEHPVTELVTGVDLVAWQLRVSEGAPLPMSQTQLTLRGHAIEARLYAEDPGAGFMPQAGALLLWAPAAGPGVRVDHGLQTGCLKGQEITAHYDPMVAKVIAHGATRDEARRRLQRALERTLLFGPRHNKAFLRDVLEHPGFAGGEATTRFLESRFDAVERAEARERELSQRAWAIAALLWTTGAADAHGPRDGWRTSAGTLEFPLELRLVGRAPREATLAVTCTGPAALAVRGVPGRSEAASVRLLQPYTRDEARARVELDGLQEDVGALRHDDVLYLDIRGVEFRFAEVLPAAAEDEADASGRDGVVRAPATGRVVAVHVTPGDRVREGQALVVVESMKIQQTHVAAVAGLVVEVAVTVGAQVAQRGLLVKIEPDAT